MRKLRYVLSSMAVSAIILGGMTTAGAGSAVAAPPAAEGVIDAQGMCSGNNYGKRAKAIKRTVKLKKDYYNASPTVRSVGYGSTMAVFKTAKNKYGNKWHKVQYSTIRDDWCGWVSDNWVEIYWD